MTAPQLRSQLRKWGAQFKEFPDWDGRGRPGTFSPVGLTIHHTGSDSGQNSADYDTFLFITGRPAEGIPGPLCHAACEMDGDLILGATGRANHAGAGSSAVLALVKADKVPLDREVQPGPDDINGNTYYYGLEVKFDGGQPMTSKAYRSALLWAAAICDFYGWSAQSVIGHREHSRRKGDPGNTPMDKFRRDLAAVLKAGPTGTGGGTPVPPPEGVLSVSDVQTILTKLDALHEIATGRYIQEVEEARAQSKAALAALQSLTDYLESEEREEDFFDTLTGQRWAQTQDTVAAIKTQLAEAVAKLDAHVAPPAADVN